MLLYFPARERLLSEPAVPFGGPRGSRPGTASGCTAGGCRRPERPRLGHVLLLHGNAGNIGDRVTHLELLAAARGSMSWRSTTAATGAAPVPSRASRARTSTRGPHWRRSCGGRTGSIPARIVYLGKWLGGAIALELAGRLPTRGLVLQSTFTGIRDMARRHYPQLHAARGRCRTLSLPRACGSCSCLRAPLLILHGDRDEIVPLMDGQALFDAAPEPKQMHVFRGVAAQRCARARGARVGGRDRALGGSAGEAVVAGSARSAFDPGEAPLQQAALGLRAGERERAAVAAPAPATRPRRRSTSPRVECR